MNQTPGTNNFSICGCNSLMAYARAQLGAFLPIAGQILDGEQRYLGELATTYLIDQRLRVSNALMAASITMLQNLPAFYFAPICNASKQGIVLDSNRCIEEERELPLQHFRNLFVARHLVYLETSAENHLLKPSREILQYMDIAVDRLGSVNLQ
jgi:hypothetical protein